MKSKKEGILAVFLAVLIIAIPFSSAQIFDFTERAREETTGESIVVNVKGYEPEVLPSSLIEDGDVPVYAFLTGGTPASISGVKGSVEPLYGQALIKQVYVRPMDQGTFDAIRGAPNYERPEQYSMDNLGYVIITLKQVEEEANVPDEITLNMQAEVTFENVDRLYSLIQQDLMLPDDPDEEAWRLKGLDDYSFFSRRGFVRVREITGDTARLTLYAGSDMVWPYTGAPRPIADVSLSRGEVSDYYRLSEMNAMTNAFRVKLTDIVDPMDPRAKLRISVNGVEQEVVVRQGSALYPGSNIIVESISSKPREKDGQVIEEVVIRDAYGGRKTVARISETTSSQKTGDKAAKIADPCDASTLTISSSETQESLLEKMQQQEQTNVYCTAAAEYKKIVSEYYGVVDDKGVLYEDMANFKLGKIYEWIAMAPEHQQLALEYYKKAVKNNKGGFVIEAQSRIDQLQQDVENNAVSPLETFEEPGQTIAVKLVALYGPGSSSAAKATLLVGDSASAKSLSEGQAIFAAGDLKPVDNAVFNWRISKIMDSYVLLEKYYTQNQPQNYVTETRRISLKDSEAIEGRTVYVKSIDTKKFALITVIPGTGEPLVSVSNFTIHIPVEKRLIQWTPSEISSKINSTEAIMKDLDGIINKLGNVVTTWKKVCMFTFAYLTIKNSFFTGLSRTQARKFAMHGADGTGGWNAFCRDNSGAGRLYGTYDQCVAENSGKIETTIDSSQKAIGQVNGDMENYKEKQWYLDMAKDYPELEKYQKYMGEDLYDANALRDYRYWQLMKQSDAYNELTGERVGDGFGYNFKREVNDKFDSFKLTNEDKLEAYKATVSAISKNYGSFDTLDEEQKSTVFADIYNAYKGGEVTIESDKFQLLPSFSSEFTALSMVRKDKNGNIFAYTSEGEKDGLKEATVGDYKKFLEQKRQALESGKPSLGPEEAKMSDEKIKAINEEIDSVNETYGRNMLAPFSTSQGGVLVKEGKFYIAKQAAYSAGVPRETYAEKGRNIEFYPDGRPYCVPTCYNGNYVKVLDFYKDGSPRTMQEWNVGTDGFLCTGDDLLVKHQSVLDRPEYETESNRLRTMVTRMGSHKEGEALSICGKTFIASSSRSRADTAQSQPNCYDTMDPDDCRLLFGVCDPVMCPPSRFNLGGSWQVQDVVQTGVIGSVVLGLPNFDMPYEPVPVCLTGVLAGLQNIKSVLQGYVECLKVAQVSGKSVGICDKIRSVFICDMLWREAIAIFNVKGGVLTWVAQTLFGEKEGGGEYMTFQSSLQNVADSVSFFTKQYATTAFAAYNARSTDEIGATICKQAVFGKFPGIGNFIDELAKPESPPQYTALLTEYPFSETRQQYRYQAFYHIYAGEDKEAAYSVYLENSVTKDAFYVTERCEGRRGAIAKGGIASFTLDCTPPPGSRYDRICVSINGMTNCGFGKVSSEFAINYLNDLVVADEAKRKISSESECYPSSPTTSPSLGSLPLSGKIDILTTGIARVCSMANPGMGTNPLDWKEVGDCGKDANGRSLGRCWLDVRTVSLNDAERMTDVRDALDEQGFKNKKLSLGITDLLDEKSSLSRLSELRQIEAKDCPGYANSYIAYTRFRDQTIVPKFAAEAQYTAGEMMWSAAQSCARIDMEREVAKLAVTFEKLYAKYNKMFNEARINEKLSGDAQEQRRKELQAEYRKALAQSFDALVTEDLAALQKSSGMTTGTFNQYQANLVQKRDEWAKKEIVVSATAADVAAEISGQYCDICGQQNTERATTFWQRFTGVFKDTVDACDMAECNAIGGCYFVDRNFAAPGGTCYSCTTAQKCSDFEQDMGMCGQKQCMSMARLDCKASVGKCEPVAVAAPSAGGVVVDTDYGSIALKPDEQCGTHNHCSYEPDDSVAAGTNSRKYIVIHITEGGTAADAASMFQTGKLLNGTTSADIAKRKALSVQYLLERDGGIIQQVKEDKIAQHVGAAYNAQSIGIEIANSGPSCDAVCGQNRLPSFNNVQCRAGDCVSVGDKKWEKFSDEQMKALVKLVAEIALRNNIDVGTGIISHGTTSSDSSCAPRFITAAKSDPGPLFDWCKFEDNVAKAVMQYSTKTGKAPEVEIGGMTLSFTGDMEEAQGLMQEFGCTDAASRNADSYRQKMQTFKSGGKTYKEIIQAAGKNDEDRAIIAGIIAQESGFRADAVSPTGCTGLMQLCSAEAFEQKLCGDGSCATNDQRKDAAKSISAGYEVYKDKLAAVKACTKGKEISSEDMIKLAVMAYNAGEGVVCAAAQLTAMDSPTFKDIAGRVTEPVIKINYCRNGCSAYFDTVSEREDKAKEAKCHAALVSYYIAAFRTDFQS